jgi:hypothetical protein
MLIRWSAPGPGGREYERLYNVEAQFRSLLNKRVRPRQKHQPLKGMGGGGGGACAGLPVSAGRAGAIDFGGDRQAACKTLSPIPNAPGVTTAGWRGPSGGSGGGLALVWCREDGGLAVVWRGPGGSLARARRWSGEGPARAGEGLAAAWRWSGGGLAAFGQNGYSNQVGSPDRLKLQQLAGKGGRRITIGKG